MIKRFLWLWLLFCIIPTVTGIFCNGLVMATNGSSMPVDFSNCTYDGCTNLENQTMQNHAMGIGSHHVMNSDTKLRFLGDIYTSLSDDPESGEKLISIYSIGDVFIGIGFFCLGLGVFWIIFLLVEFVLSSYRII